MVSLFVRPTAVQWHYQKWSGSGLTLGILKASGAQPFQNMMKYYHLHDIEEGRVCIGSNGLNIT